MGVARELQPAAVVEVQGGITRTPTRWDPFGSLLGLHAGVGPVSLFSDVSERAWRPQVDIFEKDDDLVIRAEVPGVDRDDLDIHVENGNLVLRGKRKRDTDSGDGKVYLRERFQGTFSRRFGLPDTVDASLIAADYKDGVLTITLPKSVEAKPRKIAVNAA